MAWVGSTRPTEGDVRRLGATLARKQPQCHDIVERLRLAQLPLHGFRHQFQAEHRFAHPFERDFARLLSFYRLRWSYEPTVFGLRFRDDGRACESFTPDFYLPDLRLYIELTSMRQALVTRKHRKLRLLRERYPDLQVRLLYRRDYHRLLTAWSDLNHERLATDCPAPMVDALGRLGPAFVSPAHLAERLESLAKAIAEGLPGPEPLLLGVDESGYHVATRLGEGLARLGRPVDVDQLSLSRFKPPQDDSRIHHVRVKRPPTQSVAGRPVILVLGIVSTGLSVAFARSWLERRGARAIQICVLFDRHQARVRDVPLDYIGFDAPNDLLVGFGLDLLPRYQMLPYVATLPQ